MSNPDTDSAKTLWSRVKSWLLNRDQDDGTILSNGWVILGLTVLSLFLIGLSDRVADGFGHIDLQLANDRDGVLEVLRDNRRVTAANGFDGVRNNLYVDMVFIAVWVPLVVGLLQFTKRHWYSIPRVHKVVDLVTITVVLAGIFDYIENFLILSYLPHSLSVAEINGIDTFRPMLATGFAIAKYVVVFVSAAIVLPALLGGFWRVVSRVIPFHRWPVTRALSMQTLRRPKKWSQTDDRDSATPAPGVGVCFSGGGIRAGSFALGGIQALQDRGVIGEQPGLMTSVSGGGYIAGAYEMARTRGVFAEGPDPKRQPPFAAGSDEERFVRNHSAYLTYERGQKLVLAGHLLRGIAINALAVFAVLYVVLRPAGWALWELNAGLVETAADGTDRILFAIPAAHLLALAMVLAVGGISYFLTMMPTLVGEADHHDIFALIGRACMGWALTAALVVLGIPAALWFTFVAIPFLLGWLVAEIPIGQEDQETKARFLTLVGAGGSLAFIAEGVRRQLQKATTSVWAVIAAVVVVPALLMYIVASIVKGGYVDGINSGAAPFGEPVSERWIWFLALFGVYAWGLMSDQRGWSLHRYYKRRLANAFSVERVRDVAGSDNTHAEQISYEEKSHFKTPPGEQPLVVACVANVNDYAVVPPGLNAVSFTMGESQIGGPDVGYVDTEVLKKRLEKKVRRRDITVQAAVAISGAAASPAMGKMSKPMLRFLIAFANVRLGVWFPNPRWLKENGLDEAPPLGGETEKVFQWLPYPRWAPAGSDDEKKRQQRETYVKQWYDRPRLPYLFKEMLGLHSIDDRFLYLTDGGHIDNLGLVELFRRGCTTIYAFDASGGEPGTFSTIGEAMALARAELGVEVELRLEQIRPLDNEPPPGSNGATSWSSAEKGKGWPWSRERPIRGGTLVNQAYAIGTYRYPGEPREAEHQIVYIQAAATAEMPWSVRWYWEQNTAFPNHTTLDQNFDFREFEAYRELGYWGAKEAYETLLGTRAAPMPQVVAPS